MSKSLNELAKEIHENAVAHGWWDGGERTFGDVIALCHSELSEALEEYRSGKPMLYCDKKDSDWCDGKCVTCDECYRIREETGKVPNKPEGIAVEMADCIIRILDWCGKEGIDIDEIIRIKNEYNKTRPYKHGGKVI